MTVQEYAKQVLRARSCITSIKNRNKTWIMYTDYYGRNLDHVTDQVFEQTRDYDMSDVFGL